MSEWFVNLWPYYVAVLVATVFTVLVLWVTFRRLRELHLEIERLQLKNEHLRNKLKEDGVTTFKPSLQVTRFGLLGNLMPVLVLVVLILVVLYSGIQGMSARAKHIMELERQSLNQESAFHKEVESLNESIKSTEAAFGNKIEMVQGEMRTFQAKFATHGHSEHSIGHYTMPSTDVQKIEKKVIEIISEQMGVDKAEIKRKTSFINDLGADSLDTVELMMEFEDKFDIHIPDEDAEKIQTVGAAIDYVITCSVFK